MFPLDDLLLFDRLPRFGRGAAFNEQFERILREFEEQLRRGGPGFGPFGVPPQWEQQYDRSGFDARRQGERQRQQQSAYEEQYRRRQAGQRTQAASGYRSGDPLGYYKELGLAKGSRSSEEEIKAAFRRLALEWHPDRHGKDPTERAKAEEKFKKISQAYQVLRDSRKRADYDAGLAT